ncbi:MAG: diguanylate cyclase [Hyphomicrobiales bacterium]|nr:diguanylate cyclase [Hyphomicrobiales bacterium]
MRLPIAAFAAAAIAVLSLFAIQSLAQSVRLSVSQHYARGYAEAMAKVREYYSAIVVSVVERNGLTVSQNYHHDTQAIPSTDTFIKEVGALPGGQNLQFYSRYPFAHSVTAQPLSPFQERALAFFERGEGREYSETEPAANGGSNFLYATPATMKGPCVACHNADPNSPRHDWKIGDLAGAVAIAAPLKMRPIYEDPAARLPLILMGVAVLIATVLAAGFVATHSDEKNARNTVAELERQHELLEDAQAQITRLAYEDHLSGLPNRRCFESNLDAAFEELAEGRRASVSIALFDLARFKQINDRHGHPAGDELIRIVSQRLRAGVPGDCIAARLGGDEFAVLAGEETSGAILARVCQRLLERLAEPYEIHGAIVHSAASAGLATHISARRADQILSEADKALYRAKAKGAGVLEIFTPDGPLVSVVKASA